MAYTNDIYGQIRRIADDIGGGDGYTNDIYGQIRRIADALGADDGYTSDRYGQVRRIADAVAPDAQGYTSDLFGQWSRIADAVDPDGGPGRSIYAQIRRIADAGISNDPTIQLSSTTIAEDASVGDPLGTLSVSNGSGTYTFSIAGGTLAALFAIDVDVIEVDDTLSATTGTLEIEADNGVDPVLEQTFNITITAATGDYTPSLDFSDARNSMYVPAISY